MRATRSQLALSVILIDLAAAALLRVPAARTSVPRCCTYESIRPLESGERPGFTADDELEVTIAEAAGKGRGAFAVEDTPAGRWVCQYVGTPVTLLETAQRYTTSEPEYLFQLTPDLYLDAQDSTHFSRFFNHAQECNMNFTVTLAERRIDFYTSRPVLRGEELTFDYGEGYWAGSALQPADGTDSRTYEAAKPSDFALDDDPSKLGYKPAGPPPLTPTSAAELDEAIALPDGPARAGMLRALEYYGATRLSERLVRIPLGVAPGSASREVDPQTVPIAELQQAVAACIAQATHAPPESGAAPEGAVAASADRASFLTSDELELSRKFQGRCPPFATPEHNAAGLAVLLMWSFPERHDIETPISTERWEALLAHLRAHEGSDGVAFVLDSLREHAPPERVDALMETARREARGWS